MQGRIPHGSRRSLVPVSLPAVAVSATAAFVLWLSVTGQLGLLARTATTLEFLFALAAAILVGLIAMTSIALASYHATPFANLRNGRVLIAGAGPNVLIANSLLADRVARFPRRLAIEHANTFAQLATTVRRGSYDHLVLSDEMVLGPASAVVDGRGRRPAVTPSTDAVVQLLGRVPLPMVASVIPHDTAEPFSVPRRISDLAKRSFDLAASLAMALVIVLLIPVIALAIRLDSAGPIFYSQNRVGLNGRIFRIYKFRTMRTDAEINGAVWATAGDPRVTRFGAFMRKARIDEWPQLWNVVRGDMTFVGPRPERPEFTTMLAKQLPGYTHRHDVKPGLTGWAQVRYRYANTVHDAEVKLEYDLYYVKYASFLFDLAILLRTIPVVLNLRGY